MSLLLLLGACYQLDGFFFNPTVVEAYTLGGDVIPTSCQELVSFDSPGGSLYGAWAHWPLDDATECVDTVPNHLVPLVLYFHGNSDNIDRYWDQVEFYWQSGYEVFIFDYGGYGRSWGEPSFDSVIADGRLAIDYVSGATGRPSHQLIYVGLSLGGFVSVHNLVDTPPGILITQDMFANTQKMLDDGTQLDMPSGWFFEQNYDNLVPLRAMPTEIPYLVTHGAADTYIQPEHAQLVFDAAGATTKRLFLVPGVDHADAIVEAPEVLRPEIDCWIRQDCVEG